MFCTNCGAQLQDDALFCTNCGTPTTPSVPSPESRSEHASARDYNAVPPTGYASEPWNQHTSAPLGGYNVITPTGYAGSPTNSHDFPPAYDYGAAPTFHYDNESGAAAPAKKKSAGKLLLILVPVVLVLAAGAFFGLRWLSMPNKYEAASDALAAGKYDQALDLYEELNGFKDSEAQVKSLQQLQTTYNKAKALEVNREYMCCNGWRKIWLMTDIPSIIPSGK